MPVVAEVKIKNNLDKVIKATTRKEGYDDHEELISPNEVGVFTLWEDDVDTTIEIDNA